MKLSVLGLSLLATNLCAGIAGAYNNREHQRLPDQAYQMMNILRRGEYLTIKVSQQTGVSVAPLSQRPASVPASEQALWDRFISEARLAPTRLGQLRTGLRDPRLPTTVCGNAYPVLRAGQHLAQCRANELLFPVKRGWATNTSDCYLRTNYFAGDANAPEFFDELPTDFTGALLGYYGQQVDDEVDDTVMWVRPTNIVILSELKVLASDVTEFGLAIAFAPVACLVALFSGDNCFDLAKQAAHDLNPVTEIDARVAEIEREFMRAIPWLTNIDGDDWFDTTGLWHFINVERGDGDFNAIGGMHYTQGGWRGGVGLPAGIGRIDGLDYSIIAGADLIGLTLDPDEANGVRRYQQSPDGRLNRRKGDWYLTIGHTEFEPLDNLALYGWRRFQRENDASGLGWVLHALGDAVAPHHGIAATGWGHRPYEDFAGYTWREMFSEAGVNHYFRMQSIMEHAYKWWRFMDDAQTSGNANDLPVRDMVTSLAYETRFASDFAIRNGVSLGYGSTGDEDRAREIYESDKDKARALLESGTGATLAFLAKVALLAEVDRSPSPCECPPGKALGVGSNPSQCAECSDVGMVEVDGHCAPTCPADKPFESASGSCVSTCTDGNCSGIACPNPTDFVEMGVCVTTCSAANPVAVGRECQASCPADMVATTNTTPPFCQTEPHCRATTGTRDSNGVCDEHCPSGLNFISNRTCVAQCPPGEPVFVMEAGLGNCLAACPPNLPMKIPSSSPTECLASCPTSARFIPPGTKDCVPVCPTSAPFHQEPLGNCLTACPSGAPFSVEGTTSCLEVCPPGYFATAGFVCKDVPDPPE